MKNRYPKFVLTVSLFYWFSCVYGQVTLTNGQNVLEISGLISTNYTQRFLSSGSDDFKKNVFAINTASLGFEGRVGHYYEYKIQFDLSRLGFAGDGEFPSLLDANFTLKGFSLFDITIGYDKLPYSRSNLASFANQPYWQRAEIARGGIFSRRDIGICLKKDLWHQRINLAAGAYTGMGEYSLTSVTGGDNDPSGTPEYIGRIDFSWPGRYRYNNILDVTHVPVPMISVGLNGRYVERKQSLAAGLADFDLKILSGKKSAIGFDVAAQYRGFSALFEWHKFTLRPDSNRFSNSKPLLQGKPTSYMKFGGVIGQVAYYNQLLKSGFLVRYDEFNPNDLIVNVTERTICYGYVLMLDGYKSMIRFQYWQRVGPWNKGGFEPISRYPGLLRTNDQLRIGWQYAF